MPDTAPTIKCLKVSRPDTHGGNFCMWKWNDFDVGAEFDGADIGETITLELCEMTEQEFEDLGEFDGW